MFRKVGRDGVEYGSLWFWANYYWNRLLCVFGQHIVVRLPREFAESPLDAGRPVCCVCFLHFDEYDEGIEY